VDGKTAIPRGKYKVEITYSPSHSIVLAVYLAMQAVYEIRVMAANGTLH
jgi:hypothetical protein